MGIETHSARALVIQLARLGDLVQSLPAIMALKRRIGALDLLCAAPLSKLALWFDQIDQVLGWHGERWRTWAGRWTASQVTTMSEIHRYLGDLAPLKYEVAYNLNQHNRAVLAATLFADHIIGPGESGPLEETLPPWAAYLRRVALNRGENRIHLADAFCGLCGVTPTGLAPHVTVTAALPNDLVHIGEDEGPWVALTVGAGDPDRCVPPSVWTQWITDFLEQSSGGQVVLIGSATERHRMHAIQEGMSPLLLGRVWDACGRTSLVQLAALLSRCQWVLGSDTGPLHLGAAMGARAMGFYIARARVHETGPYGVNHWVWQASIERPRTWPIRESVGLMLSAAPASERYGEWSLWQSGLDEWGAFYSLPGAAGAPNQREEVWRSLGRTSSATESYESA